MKVSKTHLNIIECVRVKTFVGSSVPRNIAFGYRNAPVSSRFACIQVGKLSKTLPNIIQGLLKATGSVLVNTFVEKSVPQNLEFGYRNAPVSQLFRALG